MIKTSWFKSFCMRISLSKMVELFCIVQMKLWFSAELYLFIRACLGSNRGPDRAQRFTADFAFLILLNF